MAMGDNLVDMALTPAEAAEKSAVPQQISQMQKYPYGLAIRLGDDELKKLGFDDADMADCEVGDYLYIEGYAKVTSYSQNDTEGGTTRCLELQITHLEVESEAEENAENEEAESAPTRLYG